MNKEDFIKFSVKKKIEHLENNYLFELVVQNNKWSGCNQFYGDVNLFKELGKKLQTFSQGDEAVFEVGDKGKENNTEQEFVKWGYYICIKFTCFDPEGHVSISVIINEGTDDDLGVKKLQFTAFTDKESINELSTKLLEWNPQQTSELMWEMKFPKLN